MLDALKVDLYGERLPLKAVGSVSVRDAQMLAVSPFDPQVYTSVYMNLLLLMCTDAIILQLHRRKI